MTINIKDYTEYIEELLPTQFCKAENTKSLLDIILTEYNVFGDNIQELITQSFDVDQAEGHQLDLIGKLSNVLREGRTDVDYRRAIKLKRFIDNSSGVHSELITFLKDISNGTEARSFRHYPAAIALQTNGEDIDQEIALSVEEGVAAGIHLLGVIHNPLGTEVMFPEVDATLEAVTVTGAGGIKMKAGEPLALAGSYLVQNVAQGSFGEVDDLYENLFPQAGEDFMFAGEEDALASDYVIEDNVPYGTFAEIYGA